ncbi:hypothetical protein [Silvanigrella aquatica]|uniref:Entry exclusion lipoprotein TrbK n=1 Tax=Silvanigrella aquatica TaxID=1915309 RepID=A0A1L4D0M6_9BACT|nr:hypothetical protein [Silvanigrella aquatica]APJ03738.1 hypothetical protein AXG55_07390 [Silvanigrella aquatica]
MKKISIIMTCCLVFGACTYNLDDKSPPKKSNEEVLDELCAKGNQQACNLADEFQKKKEERYQKIIKDSGLRSK